MRLWDFVKSRFKLFHKYISIWCIIYIFDISTKIYQYYQFYNNNILWYPILQENLISYFKIFERETGQHKPAGSAGTSAKTETNQYLKTAM